MTYHAYLFEIRSIQRFLFATGKLRDMIAGSELIDYLCLAPLSDAISACGLSEEDVLQPRRAGGAAYLLLPSSESADRLQRLWRLLVNQLLPGIELVDARADGDSVPELIREGLDRLQVNRNRLSAQIPAASPLTALSPRTGLAAHDVIKGEHIDAATRIKRSVERTDEGLTSRFGGAEYLWPNNFESDSHESRRFPLNDDQLIALIHIDGNGLGEVLRQLNQAATALSGEAYVTLYKNFSRGLEQATCAAAKYATQQILIPAAEGSQVLPARPLVLGGDDLSLIVRADLALDYCKAFIEQFESATSDFLRELAQQVPGTTLPDYLTACGGITIMKASHPFSQGYNLAEGLCGRAKGASRKAKAGTDQVASSLAIHRIQTATSDSAEVLFDQEMRVQGEDNWPMGLPAYRLGRCEAPDMPNLSTLLELVEHCQHGAINFSRLRRLATLLHQDKDIAESDYRRWRKLSNETESGRAALQGFDHFLEQMVGELDPSLPFSAAEPKSSPLADLLMLLSITGKKGVR